MKMIGGLVPSSKMAIKQQCLVMMRGDVKAAKELYDFLVDGESNLPEVDPPTGNWLDQVEGIADRLMDWGRKNQDVLQQGVELVRGFARKKIQNDGFENVK